MPFNQCKIYLRFWITFITCSLFLTEFVSHHVTRKIICGDAIVISCGLTNMNGYRLKVSCTPEGHFVANSKLIEHDMVADNGIVHAIDTVLLPDAGLYMKQGMETSENRHFEWCRFIFFFYSLLCFLFCFLAVVWPFEQFFGRNIMNFFSKHIIFVEFTTILYCFFLFFLTAYWSEILETLIWFESFL